MARPSRHLAVPPDAERLPRTHRAAARAARLRRPGHPRRQPATRALPLLLGRGADPAEWPEQAHVTGSWFLDSEDHAPDAALAAFLDEGEPDLYIGFGSMALGRASHEWSAAVAGALRRTGARAVVATGWGGLDADALPPTALPVHHVPHDWLFPWVRALVHHGGSGTVAAGLRAGRPTLVCPVLGDQPFWGDRLHELGVGPRPLPVKKLTADVLAERIQELLGNPAHAEKAEHVGRALRAEDGVRVAAEVIETVARR